MRGSARQRVKQKPSGRTVSEVLFEKYLEAQGVPGVPHEASVAGKARHPDYIFEWNGVPLVCEVKELHEKRPMPAGGADTDPYSSVREKINQASKQFQEYKDSPCVLVLYNVDDWEFDSWPPYLFGAMLGDLGLQIPFDLDACRALIDDAQSAFLGRGKMVDPRRKLPQNTTISAIAVLSEIGIRNPEFWQEHRERVAALEAEIGQEVSAEQYFQIGWDVASGGIQTSLGQAPRVVVTENPLARLRLPEEVFRGPYDERHRFRPELGRIERVYAGDRLVEMERESHAEIREQIERFTQQIVEKFEPQRIILFGSHAYGSPGPDSDVDMLVIFPGKGDLSRRDIDIRKRIRCRFPLDLLTRSAGQIDQRLRMGDTFMRDILERGTTLYPRGAAGRRTAV